MRVFEFSMRTMTISDDTFCQLCSKITSDKLPEMFDSPAGNSKIPKTKGLGNFCAGWLALPGTVQYVQLQRPRLSSQG